MNYFDKYGLLSCYPDASCGNGLLYSAEWLYCRNVMWNLTQGEVALWKQIYESCEKLPGLMMRHPEHPDQQGPDDYFGCGTASAILYPANRNSLAGRILDYGQSKKILGIPTYNYNNVNPETCTKHSWFGRFPALIAHLHYACNLHPGCSLRLCWILGLLHSAEAKRGEQDRFAMGWHMSRVVMMSKFWQRDTGIQNAVGEWIGKFRKVYPGGMSELRSEYFQNSEHTLVHELEVCNE